MGLYITTVTYHSIKAKIDGLDPDYSRSNRKAQWYLDGELKFTRSIPAKVEETSEVTFSGLNPGSRYVVRADIYVPANGEDPAYTVKIGSETVKTKKKPVALWNWSKSNGEASASQTRSAYNAVSNHGSLRNFSYLVWNDLAAKVNEQMAFAGGVWSNKYCSYNETLMSENDKWLTAERFNSLRFQVGSHVATDILDKKRGDQVEGAFFTRITDCLNEWITQTAGEDE